MGDAEANASPPAPAVDAKLRRNRSAAFVIAFLVFAFDQAAKWVVTIPLDLPGQPGRTIRLFSFFDLHWTENRGISLGLLSADGDVGRWLLVAMTAAIAAFVTIWMWRERKRTDSVALGLVLGGALGNIVDRARLGYVVDYADLHFGEWGRPFLVFNVGDAAITVGVLLLLVRALLVHSPRGSGV